MPSAAASPHIYLNQWLLMQRKESSDDKLMKKNWQIQNKKGIRKLITLILGRILNSIPFCKHKKKLIKI